MPGLASRALPVPPLALVQMPCQVDKGRVGNACHKEDDVAGSRNGYHGSGVIDPKERPPGEQYGIDKLREQGRAVVPQPQEFLGIPKLFSRKGPPFIVCGKLLAEYFRNTKTKIRWHKQRAESFRSMKSLVLFRDRMVTNCLMQRYVSMDTNWLIFPTVSITQKNYIARKNCPPGFFIKGRKLPILFIRKRI